MGETSMSRYSIVERLISKKIEFISKISKLSDTVKDSERDISVAKNEYDNWLKSIRAEKKISEIKYINSIKNAEGNNKDLIDNLKRKTKVYNDQIKAIEDALKRIENISKDSL